MFLFKQLLSLNHGINSLNEENNRKYHLIHAISCELFILSSCLIFLNVYLDLSFITYLLIASIFIVIGNLILLKKNISLLFCGHVINILCFTMITLGNIWLGGTSTSSLAWFYISPIIAAVTIGIEGLIIYGLLSACTLAVFITAHFSAFHLISPAHNTILNNINHTFIFLLICTILYNLLAENKHYESLLKEQNFLLTADKQKFHYLSHHDSLTNLPNRSYFHTFLQELLDTADTESSSVTVYFMDLDGFKEINDRYGHETGDLLLLQTSKRLQSCFRKDDFIARLGGDEFTAIIKHKHKDKITNALIARIKKEFKEPFFINQIEINCPMSIGKASYPSEAHNAETLLKIADESMYQQKRSKRINLL